MFESKIRLYKSLSFFLIHFSVQTNKSENIYLKDKISQGGECQKSVQKLSRII